MMEEEMKETIALRLTDDQIMYLHLSAIFDTTMLSITREG